MSGVEGFPSCLRVRPEDLCDCVVVVPVGHALTDCGPFQAERLEERRRQEEQSRTEQLGPDRRRSDRAGSTRVAHLDGFTVCVTGCTLKHQHGDKPGSYTSCVALCSTLPA